MLGYLVHRILIMIPTLIAISIVIFVIIHLPPGDYFSTYIAELQSQGENANLAKIEFLRAEYGFDKPLWEQYIYWVVDLLRGDMGYSFVYDMPVNRVVGDRLFLTFLRSFTTIVCTYIVAFPIAVYSSTHQYSVLGCRHCRDAGWRKRPVGPRRGERAAPRQPQRGVAQAMRRARTGQGPASVPGFEDTAGAIGSVVMPLPTPGPMLLEALRSQD